MEGHEQRHIADLIRQQRFKLEGLRAGLDEGRGELVEKIMLRMYDAEYALEADLERRGARRFSWRRLTAKVERLRAPRIGHLRHHSAVPLTLPAGYWEATAPDPAPTISIVTPSYGQGSFIERTIASIVGQQYPRLEYVVQDGGSTDATVPILRHHEASLASWASEPDGGHADALNRGFARTSGEIMAYVNSDDLLLPGSGGAFSYGSHCHGQARKSWRNTSRFSSSVSARRFLSPERRSPSGWAASVTPRPKSSAWRCCGQKSLPPANVI